MAALISSLSLMDFFFHLVTDHILKLLCMTDIFSAFQRSAQFFSILELCSGTQLVFLEEFNSFNFVSCLLDETKAAFLSLGLILH